MIRDHVSADNALADAIWWLKGFVAAVPTEDRDVPKGLEAQLREVRMWLDRLPVGLERLVGKSEATFGIVLTEHEFEVLTDALRTGGEAEREMAITKLRRINDKFTKERLAFGKPREEVGF